MPLPLTSQTTLVAATALFTAGAYLNAKFGIGYDLRVLRHQRAHLARVAETFKRLGDEVELYRLLEVADQDADAIWFEGKTIIYRELKESKLSLGCLGLRLTFIRGGCTCSVFGSQWSSTWTSGWHSCYQFS